MSDLFGNHIVGFPRGGSFVGWLVTFSTFVLIFKLPICKEICKEIGANGKNVNRFVQMVQLLAHLSRRLTR